jgi:glycerol uptake facilitator protein
MWAEFFGCFVLIAFGDGVVAMLWALFGSGRTNSGGALQSGGDWLLIAWGWGLAVTFGVYVAGGISGAHLNPAVTFGAAIRKQIPWARVPRYWVAQTLGCFFGAALVFLVYNNAINHYDQVNHIVKGTAASVSTFSTFATFPAAYFHNVLGPLVDQIVGTFFLVLFVWAVTDEFNTPVGANLAPFIVGLIVLAVGISFGANAGYAINPARDFGPRMFALIAGWGKVAFPGNYGNINDYFWIPIVGPLIGGALASVLWDHGIRTVLIARRRAPEPGVVARGGTVDDEPEREWER